MQRISITNPQNVIDGTAKKYYFKLRNTGGPKGDKGDKGDTGATGPQGPQGNAATVSVGSTTTLPVGYDATVTNTGSIYNAVLNFGIPQGPQGPQGAKGDKGDTGAKGDTGPRGPQGEKGTNATVYVGTTSTLAPGSQATVYNSGSDSNAVLNFGIPQGAKGDTGSQGPQGPAGPAGQNFAPTVVAALPATGDESKLYLTPKSHTSQTATGNPITATVSDGAGSMESFQLDGDTFQQTYTGKNLFNKANYLNNTYINASTGAVGSGDGFVTIYAQVSPSTEYTISKLSTSRFIVAETTQIPAVGDTVTVISGTGQTSEVKTATTSANASYLVIMVKSSSDTLTTEQILDSIQIETGSTASSYEPFVGGIPAPNPDYPQPIQTVAGEQTVTVVGKNLFDKNDVVNGIPSASDGSITSTSSAGRTSGYIPVTPNTTYSHTGHPLGWAVIAWYKTDKSFIERADNVTTTTSPNEAAYARVSCAQGNLGTCQFEIGQPTTYAPYSKQTLPLDLGTIELCKLGTYQDYIWKDGEDWKVHKAIVKKTFSGLEDWVQYSNGFFYAAIGSLVVPINAAASCLSQNYIGVTSSSIMTDFITYSSNYDYAINLHRTQGIARIKNTDIQTSDALKTWLQSNPTFVYYPVATPTDTTITDTNLIAQLEAVRTASLENGANTIANTATGSNLAGDMEIGYYGYNPRNRYDKFIWLDLNNNYEQIGE